MDDGTEIRTLLVYTYVNATRIEGCPYPALRFAGGPDLLAAPHLQRVVLLAPVVGVEELLEPLEELEVVLELALDEPVHRHDLVDVHLLEGRLQHLEVADVLVLQLCVELYLE